MISLKYGTIPIVRKTGGLSDSIMDFEGGHSRGYGFVFEKAKSSDLKKAIARALLVYRKRRIWTKLMRRAMILNFSWESSAKKYVELYKNALTIYK
jgi:starch synthase